MRHRGFTLTELVTSCVLLLLFIGFSHAIIGCGDAGSVRRESRSMQSATQVRGILQGMANFSPGSNEWYPGLTGTGAEDTTVLEKSESLPGVADARGFYPEYRYALMIRNSYFSPEYAVSPDEIDPQISPLANDEDMTDKNYSYAMLVLSDTKGNRAKEWKQTINSKAVVMSDRNIGATGGMGAGAAASTYGSDVPWRGVVGFNDKHVTFETTHVFLGTTYAHQAEVPTDNLFAPDNDKDGKPGNDALMTYRSGTADDGQVTQKPQ